VLVSTDLNVDSVQCNNIGADLLKLLQNVIGARFFETHRSNYYSRNNSQENVHQQQTAA